MEEWRDIENFPGYQVSSEGRVRSFWKKEKKNGCWGGCTRRITDEPFVLKESDDGNGYMKVYLQNDSKRRCVKVHRLVAEAFIPRESGEMDTVDHIKSGKDGKFDNSVNNLRWISRRDNIQKAYKDGIHNDRIRRSRNEVLCVDTWEGNEKYYPSLKVASEDLNLHQTSISHAISDGKLVKSRYSVDKINGMDAMLYRNQYYGDVEYGSD